MDGAVPLFRMEGISKRYGGVRALEKAELSVSSGSCLLYTSDAADEL